MNYKIGEITQADKKSISNFIAENWGSPISVSKGKVYKVSELAGFISKNNKKIIGLVTYNIEGSECEIVTLDSKINNKGLGTELVNSVIRVAKEKGCKRVWLITTNDNANAIKFYQKRGFEWAGFYKDAMKISRKMKPEIPLTGNDNIPIKHEIEFELFIK